MADGQTRTYSQDDVNVVWGDYPLTNISGEIRVSKDEDDWTFQQGADGHVVRSKKHNNIGTVVVPIAQGSPDNERLSLDADEDARTGNAAKQFMIRDNRGKAKVSCPTATILKAADMSFGEEAGVREWTFKLAPIQMHDGPNSPAA